MDDKEFAEFFGLTSFDVLVIDPGLSAMEALLLHMKKEAGREPSEDEVARARKHLAWDNPEFCS